MRYDAAGQGGLATHTDDSELSFNLLLSDPADFGGGGTSFEAAGETARPNPNPNPNPNPDPNTNTHQARRRARRRARCSSTSGARGLG